MRNSLSSLQFIATLLFAFLFFNSHLIAQAEGWQQLNDQTLEHLRKGDYKAALNAGTLAHERAAQEFGYKHHNYIASLHNLASVYTKSADYDQARYLFHNALQISSKVFGKDHIVYAISAYRLGDLLQLIDKNGEALQLYTEALPIIKKVEGVNSFHYATALAHLAKLNLKMEDPLQAEGNLIKSYSMREQCEECTAADLAENIHLLANVYVNMGRKIEAIDLYKKVLIMRADAQGKQHPDYAETLHDYALLLSETSAEEAITLLSEALQIKETALGAKHPLYQKCKTDLEKLLHKEETSMRD